MKKVFIGPLFEGINQPKLLDTLLMPRYKTCMAGEQIELALGDESFFGLVLSGNIQCRYGSFEKGQCFGLCFAITGSENAVFTSRKKSRIVLLPAKIFAADAELPEDIKAKLMANTLKLLAQELDAERLHTKLLSIHGVRRRLCAYLATIYNGAESAYIDLPMNRAQLADYLALSRPSMSRELCALRDQGILEFDGCTVKILDAERLFS